VKEVLGRDQLEHGVTEILKSLVILQPAHGVFVVVGTMCERLLEQRQVVKADSKRPLQLVERVFGLS
jgi:hypothetical protein